MIDHLVLRPLGLPDLPAYKNLRDELLLQHPDAFTSDAETEARRPAHDYVQRLGDGRTDGGHFTLGAFDGATLAGAISCEREQRVKVHHIGQVVGMMVRSAYRGRGIGRALLEGCIARARSASGLEMLTLSVTSSNEAAVALYERCGFARYGELRQAIRLGNRHVDKTLMVLYLNRG
jgi:ribosomal protein S18 acetylase RimI-like enzyme